LGIARATPAVRHTFFTEVLPKADATETHGAVAVVAAETVLPALARATIACGFTNGRRRIAAVRVDAGGKRRRIGIEHPRALFLAVAVDVRTGLRKPIAVEVFETIDVNAATEPGILRASAEVVFRALLVEVTRDSPVDAARVLAGEAKRTIETGVATRRDAHTTHPLARDVRARAPFGTHRVAVAGTAARKETLFDRDAIEVATRFDANRAGGTVAVGAAKAFGRTRLANQARRARNLGPANPCGPTVATVAIAAGSAPRATLATRFTGSSVYATGCERRRKQYYSKPPISH
jgi:hypothetical protein